MTDRGTTHDYILKYGLPALPKRKEDRLIRKAQAGDVKARDLVIRSNMPAVIWVAKKHVPVHSHIWDDCLSAGLAGLGMALDRYEPRKLKKRGAKFITYAAWWIYQGIQAEFTDMHASVRFPRGNRCKGKPTNKQMAFAAHTIYWQESRDDDEDSSYQSLAVKTAAAEACYQDEMDDDPAILAMLKERLDPREYLVITRYYGFAGEPFMDEPDETLGRIGRDLGVTRERVRQIKKAALAKLKNQRWGDRSGFGLHAEAANYGGGLKDS